ncbi:hypothetical protein C823_002412 [Eubacterium plexicaudatum ASF492]|nr:hypothetical protein C823_002412 [Eubacterium plexicaudatum ASF492]
MRKIYEIDEKSFWFDTAIFRMEDRKMAKYRKVQVEYVIAGILLMYTFFSENVMLTGNTNYIVWGVKIALVLFLFLL